MALRRQTFIADSRVTAAHLNPVLYLIPTLIDRWKVENKLSQFIDYEKLGQFRGFTGIRIEDDVLIMGDGSRVLGKELVRRVRGCGRLYIFLI